jgi:hypothetical protein
MTGPWIAPGVRVASMSAIALLAAVPAVAQEPPPAPDARIWNPPSIYPDPAAAPADDVADADWLWRDSAAGCQPPKHGAPADT